MITIHYKSNPLEKLDSLTNGRLTQLPKHNFVNDVKQNFQRLLSSMVPQQVKVIRSSLRPAVFWEEGVVGYSTVVSKPIFLPHCLAQYFIGSSSSKVSVKQPAQTPCLQPGPLEAKIDAWSPLQTLSNSQQHVVLTLPWRFPHPKTPPWKQLTIPTTPEDSCCAGTQLRDNWEIALS